MDTLVELIVTGSRFYLFIPKIFFPFSIAMSDKGCYNNTRSETILRKLSRSKSEKGNTYEQFYECYRF